MGQPIKDDYVSKIMDTQIKTSLIVAFSTIIGVLISQGISSLNSFLNKRYQKRLLLRQKYEEMMFYFQDSLSFPNKVGACKTLKELDELDQENQLLPANRAAGLALLYFDHLVPFFNNYIKCLLAYYNIILDSFNQNENGSTGAQAILFNKHKFEKVKNNLFRAKKDLLKEIQASASKYTKI